MSRHDAFMAYIQSDVWALERGVMDRAVEIFNRQIADEKLTTDEIVAATAGKSGAAQFAVMRGTAVIPIMGIIAKGAGMVNNVSQPRGTAVETIRANLRAAMNDEDVERIMLHIDSPGGSVAGVADMAADIRAAAAKKPVTAFIEDTGASAAYWLGSQATKVFANKSAAVGSIGVYAVIVDSSKAAESRGLKFHVVRSGPMKGAGEVGDAITDDQLAGFQERIDDVFGLFVDAVADGRGMSTEKVLAVADGSVFTGRKAKSAGLVDAITDFDGALKRTAKLQSGEGRRAVRGDLKEPIMANDEKADQAAAALAAHNEEAAAHAAKEQTLAEERKRTADIMGAIGGFPGIAAEAIQGGLSVDEAKAKAFDACSVELGEANATLKSLATAGVAEAPAAADTDAAVESDGPAGDDGKALTYQARIDDLRSTNGHTFSQAHKVASAELPKSFGAWTEANQKPEPERK